MSDPVVAAFQASQGETTSGGESTSAPASSGQGTSAPASPGTSGQAAQTYLHSYKDDDGKVYNFRNAEELNRHIREGMLRHKDYTQKTQTLSKQRAEADKRAQELDQRWQLFMQKQSEIEKYDRFLKENPQAYQKLKQEMAQGAGPEQMIQQQLAPFEEKLSPLAKEVEELRQWKQQQEEERSRGQAFSRVKEFYPDFDQAKVVEAMQRLREAPEGDEMFQFAELVYLAEKARADIGAIERRMASGNNGASRPSPQVSGGASPRGGSEPPAKNIKEAAARAKRSLGF